MALQMNYFWVDLKNKKKLADNGYNFGLLYFKNFLPFIFGRYEPK